MIRVEYTHAFPYRRLSAFGPDGHPFLSIRAFAPNGNFQDIVGLLDSGAWWCAFRPGVAIGLGIDWRSGRRTQVLGVTQVEGYVHHLPLQLFPMPQPVACEVIFCPTLTYNLIGRHGIFDALFVGFDELQQQVHLSARNST